jgi:hypothetical protein
MFARFTRTARQVPTAPATDDETYGITWDPERIATLRAADRSASQLGR